MAKPKTKPKPREAKPVTDDDLVSVRRRWDSREIAQVYVGDVANPLWDIAGGGTKETAPDAHIYGYVFCDAIVSGSVAHSCLHGTGPHSIKVCILRQDNPPRIYNHFLALAGPKPPMWQR